MDAQARKKLIEGPWEPKTYDELELVRILKMTDYQAYRIILDCNAGDPSDNPWVAWVNHHDLVSYLKDLITPSEIPQSIEELSIHGRWLMKQGWKIDGSRNLYRWVDPMDRHSHYLLKAALSIALGRLRPKAPDETDDSIMEAEVVVKPIV